MSTQPPVTPVTPETAVVPAQAAPPVPAPRQRTEVAAFDPNDPISLYMNTAIYDQLQRVAAMMATSTFVPEHLRAGALDKAGKAKDMKTATGDCFLVAAQAFRWGMDPFSVAQHTFAHKGKLGYEGKLIAAVVNTHPRMHDALDYRYSGSGDQREVTVFARRKGDAEPKTISGKVKDWATDNAKWREMPDQMLAYRGSREWARRWLPEAVLGVKGEEDSSEVDVVDITPAPAALPEPERPRGLADVTAKLKADAPAAERLTATETVEQQKREASEIEQATKAKDEKPAGRQPGEDDAPAPCVHKPLWRLAKSADPKKKLMCPDCPAELSPMEILAYADDAKGGK